MDHADSETFSGGGDLQVPRGRRLRRPQPQRHQWFDAWRAAKGDSLKKLVEANIRFVSHHEEYTKARERKRRPEDERNHRKRIETITCNLAHAVLMPPPTGRIAVKLGNGRKGRSRYDSPVYGKGLSPLVQLLEDLDVLNLSRYPVVRGEVSSIAPSQWFARKVIEFGVSLSDFGRDEAEEVVVLNRNTRGVSVSANEASRVLHREAINYTDTTITQRLREDVCDLNQFLSKADIDFLDDGLEPRVDPFERTLRRRFVILAGQEVRFDQGGRFYGGFWQNLKSHRREHIRINGEPVAVLDYGSMFTRLAYAEVGAIPPDGDLYSIPGLEGYRSGVKLAMNCFLFDGGPRRSWPSILGIGVGDDQDAAANPDGVAAQFDARLPTGWGVGRTKRAILQVHPALKYAWGRQLGYRLMFVESEILSSVLQRLASLGIPALGLHDGLLVARSKKEEARSVMIQAAGVVTRTSIPVSEQVY